VRIHLWNAFASNNSGSYIIVGRFPTEEQAARVAAELSGVLAAQSAWLAERRRLGRETPPEEPSPFRAFTQANSLTETADEVDLDGLSAWSVGHQLFLHEDWTLGLPDAFRELLQVRGGKVETRLVHVQGYIVALFELRGTLPRKTKAETLSAVVEELHADDGPLATQVPPGVRPAWREGSRPAEPVLTVGAVFDDLAASFTAVERIARRHGLEVSVQLFEDKGEGDPLASLRPCRPPLKRTMFDLWLLEVGHSPKEVARRLEQVRRVRYEQARALLDSAPLEILRWLTRPRAEQAARFLREAGARVEVRPTTV
jgi:hypothetical protein